MSDIVDFAAVDPSAAARPTCARDPIGAPLLPLIKEARRLGLRLGTLVTKPAAAAVAQALADLDGQICKIAVIGQVKAGKSSLVNALVRRPGLSPANVNPWTVAITNLHFGVSAPDGANAVFNFFDQADWRHMAKGGRLRELSDRIGLALDADTLEEQRRRMRLRVEKRLGRQFHHLLGQQHRFAAVSPEIMARYVCIGDLDEAGRVKGPASAGRFADITKSADLYFDLPPFALPTRIIDTPGINDPFLVRDDMTRRALDGADVYILVVTAQQALSTMDLAMLRVLHGLNKQRLIVFVNRIDLLSDIAGDAERVRLHVRDRLAEAFPDASIAVIAGSAYWGEISQQDGLEQSQLSPAFNAYAALHGEEDAGEAPLAGVLARCSGLPALEAVISKAWMKGPPMYALQRAVDGLQAVCSSAQAALRSDEAILAEAIATAAREKVSISERVAALDGQIRQLDALPDTVSAIADEGAAELAAIAEQAGERLCQSLGVVVRNFAISQSEALRDAARLRRMGRVWRCDTRIVRRELERVFLKVHHHAAFALRKVEREVAARLRATVEEVLPDRPGYAQSELLAVVDVTPSISALGQTVALDLGEQWDQWWRIWRTPAQRMRKLEELVLSEFEPILDTLCASAAEAYEARIKSTVGRFCMKRDDLLAALAQRRRRLIRVRLDLTSDHEQVLGPPLIARFEGKRRQQRSTLQAFTEIGSELQVLAERCATLGGAKDVAYDTDGEL